MTAAGAGAAPAARWGRTPTGWALNLDGSAASGFAVPRLEIEESAAGWICRCRFLDGTARERRTHAASVHDAQRAAAELAVGRVEGTTLAIVEGLLSAR